MKYSVMRIGIEQYSVREPFEMDSLGTMKRLKAMGYDGIEFFHSIYQYNPTEIKAQLEESGLECFGILTEWEALQPENIEKTLDFNRILGNHTIAIGSLSSEQTKDAESLYACIDYFKILHERLAKEGFKMGYHNHDTDFALVDGKTIWDHVFENTPQAFNMVLDTGNAVAGGGKPVEIIRKYPHRQEWMHIKPYCSTHFFETGYDAMIGEDDFDWPELIRTCVEEGGCQVLTIEYGNRGRFQPFYGAYLCFSRLKAILAEMDKEN